MKLKAPKQITFWVAVAVAAIGVIAKLVTIPVITGYAGWLVLIGFIVLAAGNLVENL